MAEQHYTAQRRRFTCIVLIGLAGIVILFFASLCAGRFQSGLSPSTVWQLLTGLGGDEINALQRDVFFNVRLPRVIAALTVGAAMSVAGSVYQGLFRNPLVSPDILGVSSGASFGAIGALALGMNFLVIRVVSFAFGIGAVAFTLLLSRLFSRGNNSQTASLLLTGLLCSSFFTALYMILHTMLEMSGGRDLPAILFWTMGSLGSIRLNTLWPLLLLMLAGLIPLFLIRWRLNALSFSEDEAQSLGIRLGRMRMLLHVCATLITTAIVATCGTIGWVSVITPHLARMLVGTDFRKALPFSALIGGAFVLLADGICRSLLAQEIPLSIVTSLIGAPVFIVLFLRSSSAEAMR